MPTRVTLRVNEERSEISDHLLDAPTARATARPLALGRHHWLGLGVRVRVRIRVRVRVTLGLLGLGLGLANP